MKKTLTFLVCALTIILSDRAVAYQSGHWRVGLGFYSENSLNETSSDNTGKKGFLGTTNWPLIVSYDWAMTSSWFLAPSLNYTVLPRKTQGDTAKVTLLHIHFPFGRNIQSFDYSVGPGLLRETIKGSGGTITMNNGTGTSTFAQPGREVSIQKVTFDIGAGYTMGKLRWGLDLMFIAPLSNTERTQNLMLSLTYDFSGGGGGGGMFKWSK